MTPQTQSVLRECTEGSEQGTLAFPDVLAKLSQAGVERYHADLLRSEKTYYTPNGESYVVAAKLSRSEAARQFSGPAVEAAIRQSQAGSIDYAEFCSRILAAGCVGYFVSLAGRRAVYYGRAGETYVEPFPNSAS